jgi:hypothetical protein
MPDTTIKVLIKELEELKTKGVESISVPLQTELEFSFV